MTPETAERSTAGARREQIIEAAILVFANSGYDSASTEEIARRVGISQPYLFRLFGTKRDLVLASIGRCFDDTENLFAHAAAGRWGDAALAAMGEAYLEEIRRDPIKIRAQLQAYAACEDPLIRDVVSSRFGQLVNLAESLTGAPTKQLGEFFATGMLLNVLAMMGQFDTPSPWAARLIAACFEKAGGS